MYIFAVLRSMPRFRVQVSYDVPDVLDVNANVVHVIYVLYVVRVVHDVPIGH
jgi:hypothetical protein